MIVQDLLFANNGGNSERKSEMKTLVKLMILLIVIAVCVPANADILVYKKKLKCWSAYYTGDDTWGVGNVRIRGYFVLEVNYNPDGTLAEIVGAAQVDYWRDREVGRVYEVVDHNFDIVRIVDDRSVIWALVQRETDEGDVDIVMLRGTANEIYIGNATNKEVPRKINGDQLFYWDGGEWLVTCQWSLRFYKKFTEWSNLDEDDLDDTVNNIEDWLESKGYEEY